MGNKFAELTFTDAVQEIQATQGSRDVYALMEQRPDSNSFLTEAEAGFINMRDSFYMSSVSETGWPYVQHRGGPVGFMQILDAHTIGFADYSGNRQYVSTGNFINNDRVALFFMDYPNKRRLKLLGRARIIGAEEKDILAQLKPSNYRANVERGFLINVEAFDWNCPQHITPRYSQNEIDEMMAPLLEELQSLKSNQPVKPQ